MEREVQYSTSVASVAEDLFVEVFCDTFGPEKTQYPKVCRKAFHPSHC